MTFFYIQLFHSVRYNDGSRQSSTHDISHDYIIDSTKKCEERQCFTKIQIKSTFVRSKCSICI